MGLRKLPRGIGDPDTVRVKEWGHGVQRADCVPRDRDDTVAGRTDPVSSHTETGKGSRTTGTGSGPRRARTSGEEDVQS